MTSVTALPDGTEPRYQAGVTGAAAPGNLDNAHAPSPAPLCPDSDAGILVAKCVPGPSHTPGNQLADGRTQVAAQSVRFGDRPVSVPVACRTGRFVLGSGSFTGWWLRSRGGRASRGTAGGTPRPGRTRTPGRSE
jgi:hypothetical protein